MAMVLRGLVALWGLFFAMIAVRGVINPQFFTETFSVVGQGNGANALRADFGSFFLVASGCALWAALQPHRARLLLIPATLFGIALVIRLFGLASGDPGSPAITQALIVEAISVVLLVSASKVLVK